MKIGDKFKLTQAARDDFTGQKNLADVTHRLIDGGSAEITGFGIDTVRTTNGVFFYTKDVQLVEQEQSKPNYAAAFNMWQDDFINNPQAYEDSQTVAIRHLTEKLNGEEPSYGQVASEMLIEYLEKV
jgi:hypothetical protein